MQEAQETFLSHLIELRDRLVWCLVAFAIAFVADAVIYSAELYDLLAQPLIAILPEGSQMIATGVITPFLIPMKIALHGGLRARAAVRPLPGVGVRRARPVRAREAPGAAARREQHAAVLRRAWRSATSWCSAAVFEFIAKFAPKSISVAPDIEAYFNFVLAMFLAFGVAFEVPVVVVVLVLTGHRDASTQLREWRGYVIVGIFVVAAVVTPPDVVSQIALALPLCLLYEVGIFVRAGRSRSAARPRAAAEGEAAAE